MFCFLYIICIYIHSGSMSHVYYMSRTYPFYDNILWKRILRADASQSAGCPPQSASTAFRNNQTNSRRDYSNSMRICCREEGCWFGIIFTLHSFYTLLLTIFSFLFFSCYTHSCFFSFPFLLCINFTSQRSRNNLIVQFIYLFNVYGRELK